MVINVEKRTNEHVIGKTVIVDTLMSVDESKEWFWWRDADDVKEPYALIKLDGPLKGIRQRYLMPIPPLDDDILDEYILEETKLKQPEGETA